MVIPLRTVLRRRHGLHGRVSGGSGGSGGVRLVRRLRLRVLFLVHPIIGMIMILLISV